MKTGIIICAAGKGERIGSSIPKQFIKIGEKRVIDYTLETIMNSGLFDEIVLLIRPGDIEEYKKYFGKINIIQGDPYSAQNTRRLGLMHLKVKRGFDDWDIVGIADANRPLIPAEEYKKLIDTASEYGDAIPYDIQREIPVLYKNESTSNVKEPRSNIRQTLAPCFFRFGLVFDLYESAYRNYMLDESEGVVKLFVDRLVSERKGRFVHYVQANGLYLKITTPEDVEMAQIILNGLNKS